MDRMTRFNNWFFSLFFPKRCAGCRRVIVYDEDWCEACAANLPLILPPVCPHCGAAKKDCVCGGRHWHYDRICAPLYYRDMAKRAIVRYKADALRPISQPLVELMVPVIRREYGEQMPELITFVPSYHNERDDRGYNPGKFLADEVAKALGIPSVQLLEKIYRTKPQKDLPAAFRSGNVMGVFDIAANVSFFGKRILLIDDVCTTGATLNECAKMLKIGGAAEVLVATAALVVQSEEEPF